MQIVSRTKTQVPGAYRFVGAVYDSPYHMLLKKYIRSLQSDH